MYFLLFYFLLLLRELKKQLIVKLRKPVSSLKILSYDHFQKTEWFFLSESLFISYQKQMFHSLWLLSNFLWQEYIQILMVENDSERTECFRITHFIYIPRMHLLFFEQMKEHTMSTITTTNNDTLQRVWEERDYRLITVMW